MPDGESSNSIWKKPCAVKPHSTFEHCAWNLLKSGFNSTLFLIGKLEPQWGHLVRLGLDIVHLCILVITNIQQNNYKSLFDVELITKNSYFNKTHFDPYFTPKSGFFLSYFLALSILSCSRFIATMAVFLFLYSWVNFNGLLWSPEVILTDLPPSL